MVVMTTLDWQQLLQDCVSFTQRLIQTPSMSHQEAAIARLIHAEMARLGFDDVWLDEIGNVCGRIHGQDRALGTLVLNTHTDHVDPGDPALWPVPPYSGEIVDGRILGRGACDIKGPLAVQVYSMAALKRAGIRPRRDIVFTGVVQEEIGGAGSQYWVDHLNYAVDLVVIGEPSGNTLSLGHRGILGLWVTFHGRSVHASVPHKGVNPNYALATFLQRLSANQSRLGSHDLLGPTTVSPTLVQVDTQSKNVTPAWTRVFLDFRTAVESANSLMAFIAETAAGLDYTIGPGWEGVDIPATDEPIFGYYTPPDSELVERVSAALSRGMGRPVALSSYQFATDGRLFTPRQIPVVGFAPGEEYLAHTVQESIAIDRMAESLRGYVQLLQEF